MTPSRYRLGVRSSLNVFSDARLTDIPTYRFCIMHLAPYNTVTTVLFLTSPKLYF